MRVYPARQPPYPLSYPDAPGDRWGRPVPPFPLASVGQRFAALLIDRLIAFALALLLTFLGVVLIVHGIAPTTYADGTVDIVETGDRLVGVGIACIALGILLGPLSESFLLARKGAHNGQTLGMQAIGIRVATQWGGPISAGRARGRSLFAALVSGKVFYLGYLWMLWDPRKQTWHDKVAKTYVVEA